MSSFEKKLKSLHIFVEGKRRIKIQSWKDEEKESGDEIGEISFWFMDKNKRHQANDET